MKNIQEHPVAIMGMPLNGLTADQAIETMERLIQSGGTHQVCPVNLDALLNALDDQYLHRIVASSALALPVGMPLVWVSWLLGCPLAERVASVDLVPRLAALSAEKGYRIFLLGGRPGVADRVAQRLERDYPGVRIVGTYAPAEENLIHMDHIEILSRIRSVKPDILLVAFGNPKQEEWIWMHRRRLGVPLSMGVGGSFDILAGDKRRAPRWMQQCGLEWVMRMVQEPARLAPRYLRDFMGLGWRLPLAVLAAWTQKRYRGDSHVVTSITPGVMHVYVHGKLGPEPEIADAVQKAGNLAIVNGLMMVVHLENVQQATAAGLGVLMEARRDLLEAGLSLLLAGLNLKMRFLLYAWRLQPFLEEWQAVISRGRRLPPDLGTPLHLDLATEQRVVFSADARARISPAAVFPTREQ